MGAKPSTVTLEHVLEYIEQNNIQSAMELKKSNRSYYNWVYNRKLSRELPFLTHRNSWVRRSHDEVYEKEFRENRTKEWYDIERLLPYLEHFAEVEETTVEDQCIQCYLLPEWEEFKRSHPDYSK